MRECQSQFHWLRVAEKLKDDSTRVASFLNAWSLSKTYASLLDLKIVLIKSAPHEASLIFGLLTDDEQGKLENRLLLCCHIARTQNLNQSLQEFPLIVAEAGATKNHTVLSWGLAEWAYACVPNGSTSQAIELLKECIAISDLSNSSLSKATALVNIGYLFGQNKSYQKNIESIHKAIHIFTNLGDSESIAHCHCNLAGALTSLEKFDEGLLYYKRCLGQAEENGWTYIKALALGGRGGLYALQGQLSLGLADYDASIVLLSKLGNQFQQLNHQLLKAQYIIDDGKSLELGIQLALTIIEETKERQFTSLTSKGFLLLAKAYESLGQYEKALRALRGFVTIQNELKNIQQDSKHTHFEISTYREAQYERKQNTALKEINTELRRSLDEQKKLRDQIERISQTDPLTNLANRRALDKAIHDIYQQDHAAFSILLIDIDHFKNINDTYGHQVGDEVITEFANRLSGRIRSSDLIARWGGDEFCVLLVNATISSAEETGENFRRLICEAPFVTTAGNITVTISIGIASSKDTKTPADILKKADLALYQAKKGGRGRTFTNTFPIFTI